MDSEFNSYFLEKIQKYYNSLYPKINKKRQSILNFNNQINLLEQIKKEREHISDGHFILKKTQELNKLKLNSSSKNIIKNRLNDNKITKNNFSFITTVKYNDNETNNSNFVPKIASICNTPEKKIIKSASTNSFFFFKNKPTLSNARIKITEKKIYNYKAEGKFNYFDTNLKKLSFNKIISEPKLIKNKQENFMKKTAPEYNIDLSCQWDQNKIKSNRNNQLSLKSIFKNDILKKVQIGM